MTYLNGQQYSQQPGQPQGGGFGPGGAVNQQGIPFGQMTPNDVRTWGLLIHLTGILSIIVPLILWLVKKDESPMVDQHGKAALNWHFSAMIYGLVAGVLVLIVVGIFLAAAVGICSLVFMIMAAMKANTNEVWKYPLSIPFFKLNVR